jgi:hypothetical protein
MTAQVLSKESKSVKSRVSAAGFWIKASPVSITALATMFGEINCMDRVFAIATRRMTSPMRARLNGLQRLRRC